MILTLGYRAHHLQSTLLVVCMCVCICTCMCVHMSICVCMSNVCVCVHVHTDQVTGDSRGYHGVGTVHKDATHDEQ